MDHGILKIVTVSQTIEFAERGNQGLGVSCPKNDCLNAGGVQADSTDLARMEGVPNQDESIPDTVHKPFGIVRRDICSSAGAHDHGCLRREGQSGNLP